MTTKTSSNAALIRALTLLALSACGEPADPNAGSGGSTAEPGGTGGATTSGGAGGSFNTGGIAMSGGAGGAGGDATSGGAGAAFSTGGTAASGSVAGSDSGGGTTSGGMGAAGSGGSGSGGMPIEASFETLKFVIKNVQPSCAAADCHGGNEHNPLNLVVDDELYMRLTTTISEPCGNVPTVTPGEPEQSALVMLLKGPCGEVPRMPAGCFENEVENNCVPDEYVTAIEQWVADGAPEQ